MKLGQRIVVMALVAHSVAAASASDPSSKHGDSAKQREQPPNVVSRIGGRQLLSGGWRPSIALSSDGRRLAMPLGEDGCIGICDTHSATLVRPLQERETDKTTPYLMYWPNGKKLATYTVPGTLRVWDLEPVKLIFSVPAHVDGLVGDRQMAVSPGGGVFAVSPDEGRSIRVYDAGSGSLRATVQPPQSRKLTAIAVDGQSLVGLCIGSEGWDEIFTWKLETGELQSHCSLKGLLPAASDVFLSPSGKFFAMPGVIAGDGGPEPSIVVGDTKTGKEVRRFARSTEHLSVIAFSHDDSFIAVQEKSSRGVAVLSLKSGDTLTFLPGLYSAAYQMEFSRDGRVLGTASFFGIRLWDIESGEQFPTTTGPESMWSVRFSGNGKLIVSDGPGGVRCWSTSTRDQVWHRDNVHHPTFPWNSLQVFAVDDQGSLHAIDLASGKRAWSRRLPTYEEVIRAHEVPSFRQRMPPPKARLVGASGDQNAFAYIIDGHRIGVYQRTKDAFRLLPDMGRPLPGGGLTFVGGNPDRVCTTVQTTAEWKDESSDLFGDPAEPVMAAKAVYYELSTNTSRDGVAVPFGVEAWYSRNGRYCFVSAIRRLNPSARGELYYLGARTASMVRAVHFDGWSIPPDDPYNPADPVAVTDDGTFAALVGDDGVIHVFDLRRGNEQSALRDAHLREFRCVAFSRDGKRLASGAVDGTIVVWDVSE